eukprot:1187703-Prorocentrum_minimum.AAC.4
MACGQVMDLCGIFPSLAQGASLTVVKTKFNDSSYVTRDKRSALRRWLRDFIPLAVPPSMIQFRCAECAGERALGRAAGYRNHSECRRAGKDRQARASAASADPTARTRGCNISAAWFVPRNPATHPSPSAFAHG